MPGGDHVSVGATYPTIHARKSAFAARAPGLPSATQTPRGHGGPHDAHHTTDPQQGNGTAGAGSVVTPRGAAGPVAARVVGSRRGRRHRWPRSVFRRCLPRAGWRRSNRRTFSRTRSSPDRPDHNRRCSIRSSVGSGSSSRASVSRSAMRWRDSCTAARGGDDGGPTTEGPHSHTRSLAGAAGQHADARLCGTLFCRTFSLIDPDRRQDMTANRSPLLRVLTPVPTAHQREIDRASRRWYAHPAR